MKTFEEWLTQADRHALKLMLQDSGEEKTSFERGHSLGLSTARQDGDQQMERMRIATEVTQEVWCREGRHNRKLRWIVFVQALLLSGAFLWGGTHAFFEHYWNR